MSKINEASSVESEENNEIVVNLSKIAQMLATQNATNINTIGPDWTSHRKDWQTAITVETGEMLESSAFKWWKLQVIDIENIKTEVVDLWLFTMSMFLNDQRYDIKELLNNYTPMIMNQLNNVTFIENKEVVSAEVCHYAKAFLRRVLINEDAPIIAMSFFQLCQVVGMDFEELFNRFMIKSVLHAIRQENGYTDGTYIKKWKDGLEDNVIAVSIILQSEKSYNSYEEIHETLSAYYKTNVAKTLS